MNDVTTLDSKGVWTVKNNSAFIEVTPSFYRRNILPLPDHPTPIDPNAKNLQWWAKEMAPWLSDPANLKWPERRSQREKISA